MQALVHLFFRTVGIEILTQLLTAALNAVNKKKEENNKKTDENK